ncbi:MAG: hypothetical protein H0U37_02850 [Chloroflexi bacterium]|nr:hypothetical protein [Chloroflexota bacterium]
MVQTATGVLVGAVVMAAGVAFTTPAFFGAIFSRVTPAERGAASGTASAFLDLAFGGGPVLVGVVASRSGIPAGFATAALVALVGAGGTALAGRRHRTHDASPER